MIVFNEAFTVKILNFLDSIILDQLSAIMFMSGIDKPVVRNANMQDPMIRYYIWFISKYMIY